MSDQPYVSATAQRMMLGAQLRRLREARGVTRAEAGFTIRASESKMSRLELGKVSFKERDVADLLLLYGVTDPAERDAILAFAREANRRDWWREYEEVLPDWFTSYLGLEQAAQTIRTHETQFVPGLLQTDQYTRAVISSGLPTPSPAEVDRAVALRAARQQLLSRAAPPRVWAIIDEAALRRPVGDEQTHRDQLEHLVKLTDLPHVTIQVLTLDGGTHAAAGGAFTMLRFAEPDLPEIVYVELLWDAVYLDRRDHVSRYAEVMDRLSTESLTPERSRTLLTHLIAAHSANNG